jgi:hypothetical protein
MLARRRGGRAVHHRAPTLAAARMGHPAVEDLEHLPPEELVEDILAREKRIIEIVGEIKVALAAGRTT